MSTDAGDGRHVPKSLYTVPGGFVQFDDNHVLTEVTPGTAGQVPTYQSDGTLAAADAGGGSSGPSEPMTVAVLCSGSGDVGNAHFTHFDPANNTTFDGSSSIVNASGTNFITFSVANNSVTANCSVRLEILIQNLNGSGDFIQGFSSEQPVTINAGTSHTFNTFTSRQVVGTTLEIDGSTNKFHATGTANVLITFNLRIDPA